MEATSPSSEMSQLMVILKYLVHRREREPFRCALSDENKKNLL